MANQKTPTVLIILDGWGQRDAIEDNAIANAKTPCWNQLLADYSHTLIATSGMDVGLPDGQMGNSEVGHMSLGSGRIVYQNISRINKSIADGDFFDNATYVKAIDNAVNNNKAVHITGLLSPGGVHSHQEHIFAMVRMAKQRGAKHIYVHPILDGRDTPPRSAEAYLADLQSCCDENNATIASVIGRYFAMDRDNRWDRVERAYNLYAHAKGEFTATSAQEALQQAYSRDENDEFVAATCINGGAAIDDGDAVIFMNFRADRARELTRAFVDDDFNGFARDKKLALAAFVMTTEYDESIKAAVAYPPEQLTNVLPEVLANNNRTQLRIAETEKYAHVTFFFSGGREDLYPGEERILVPSPDVATYDLQPEMSAPEVTEKLVAAIKGGQFDSIICNFANGDMVGHTGVYTAAIKAVEALDSCLKHVTDAVLEVNGNCLITADHGNCEQMLDYQTGQMHTQHTTELVPLVYVSNSARKLTAENGRLADIAPTILDLMDIEKPQEMSGDSLLA
ncbi:2,3-bisphosphoglycerate-independent phosphoglycerate mutase [BD1-7 clade bacterium]|uniref:2,3-bisphosphoglycerate-independent phosphoglycerate mutase n=1 Tax=BD1-7 clade bacterium TaxID=2029982 RepID=A0A5S9MN47_9GAMM|nr:2,3-bisphosphoglycerate-independent phosphoglycerate mutase [BD1-7 clade bacterium]